ncbi:CLUMA_CG006933, isoform A [Clunio marinus]|uniref:CLUMA_CG006933, isoform A n=1 Tax=Clunio marinus TaxID=568069 RepID=A0A1J1HZE4_9DIPT|nr:CLUMA_CG006933, isoform A [Clunio marinus]
MKTNQERLFGSTKLFEIPATLRRNHYGSVAITFSTLAFTRFKCDLVSDVKVISIWYKIYDMTIKFKKQKGNKTELHSLLKLTEFCQSQSIYKVEFNSLLLFYTHFTDRDLHYLEEKLADMT